MKGNYLGVKPSPYGRFQDPRDGCWEIYDQGQLAKDSSWGGQNYWDLTNCFFGERNTTDNSKRFSVGLAATSPADVVFKTDGTKFYVIDGAFGIIYQYSCSTAWDVSTGAYDSKSFSVTTQENGANGLFFKPDGTKFYIVGQTYDTVYQYSCSTAWDVTTASYDGKSFSVTTQDTNPRSLSFKDDGTKFYILGLTNGSIYQYSCSTAWDVSTASYDSKAFSVATQETNPQGVFFKPDGTKFYIVGLTGDSVYQYSCSTAWDVSTASYDSKSFSIATQEINSTGIFFKNDGTKFYVIGTTSDAVFQYSCSTAWDVSTARYDREAFSVTTQEPTPFDVFFKSDGTKFYVVGATNDTVYQYSCSTAWDVSTASYDSKSFSVNTQENSPTGVFFKDDGTKFYVVGNTNRTVYQYSCSTAWDVSTASYDSKSFSVTTQEATPQGLFFKPDGTKFYIVGSTSDAVFQYSCSTAWDVSTASYDSKSFSVTTQEINSTGVFFKDDGTKFYVVGATNRTVYQYSCSTAWDVSTASYDRKSFSVNAQETNPHALFFKPDGTKFYVVGGVTDTVYAYSLFIEWEIGSALFIESKFGVALQETVSAGLCFKDDGTKFYVVGAINRTVYQYSCSTAWSISTASYDKKAFSVNTQETDPRALFFKPDGTKFYIVGNTSDSVYQYSCSTAWDVSTASYDSKSFSVTTQETAPQGVFFKPDGTKFYVVGVTNDTVYQYSCSTAWDVSTASYDSKSFSVTTQETNPTGLFFKPDGTKFYIVGQTYDTVYQYSCSTAWDVSTASYDSKSFSIATQENTSTDLTFESSGSLLYIIGSTNNTIFQYQLV